MTLALPFTVCLLFGTALVAASLASGSLTGTPTPERTEARLGGALGALLLAAAVVLLIASEVLS